MHSVWKTALIVIALLGVTTSANAQNPPWADVAFCLDVSSSIDNTELATEIDGLKDCLDLLPTNGNVAVAVAVYANGAASVVNLTTVTPASLVNIKNALDGLVSNRLVDDSRTNVQAGLNVSLGHLAAGDGPTQTIVLVGDGDENLGSMAVACNAAAAASVEICAIAVAAPPVGITNFTNCATATGGTSGVADDFDDFGPICEQCLGAVLLVECLNPVVVCDDEVNNTAMVTCDQIARGTDLFGDATGVTIDCEPEGPYPVGVTDVTVTASKLEASDVTVVCTVTVRPCPEPPKPTVKCGTYNPGSVLIYPVHMSGRYAFTIINVTNTNLKPANPVSSSGTTNIKFEYINVERNRKDPFCPNGCISFDKVEVLTPADTLSVLTNCHNAQGLVPPFENELEPYGMGAEGYVVITATDPYASYLPWSHNYLVGSEIVVMGTGLSYSIEAIPFQSPLAWAKPTDLNGNRRRDFDGKEYCSVADTMYIDSFLGISDSYLACVNLTGFYNDTHTLLFSVYNDNERAMSITRPFKCWFNQRLGNVSNLFSYSYLAYTDNDDRELDIDCDTRGDLETGWAIIGSLGVRMPGGGQVTNDGAFVGCISAGYRSKISGGRLLWESANKQSNGSFGPQ